MVNLREELEDHVCGSCRYYKRCEPGEPNADCEAFTLLLKLLAPLQKEGLIETDEE